MKLSRDVSVSRILFVVIQILVLGAFVFLEVLLTVKPGPSCLIGIFEWLLAGLVGLSSFLVFGFVKGGWKKLAAFILVLVEAVALFYAPIKIGKYRRERLNLAEPARSVADARELIRTRRSGDAEVFIDVSTLPASLRIPQVYRAVVHGDHLDLITDSHPDGHRGFRIWAADATRSRKERPTKYRDISIYFYNNDWDVAPDNIP